MLNLLLLGETEARVGGRLVDLGHLRQWSVLAALAVDANRPVSSTQLIERVWGGRRLPRRPLNALQTYMSLLRRALAGADGVTIDWRSGYYRLTMDEESIDLHQFRRLIAQARATDDESRALELMVRGIELWRGEAFVAADSPWFVAVRARLHQERHAVLLDVTDIRLRRGQHGQVLADLLGRVGEHPLDERLAAQLMRALHGDGRSADALRFFETLRRRLADQLGTYPAPPLRLLHQQILRSC